MRIFLVFKVTFLSLGLSALSCAQQPKEQKQLKRDQSSKEIIVGANRTTQYMPLLQNKKVGVVANQTSVIFKPSKALEEDAVFTHLVDSLLTMGIQITKVFSPEHGFRGQADAGEEVSDGTDVRTGLPIVSLHGKHRKPTLDHLKGIDIMLFDIQDVGVRFYTYIATLQLVMEACAEANIPVIVLDRPNPNGHYVDGPTLEPEYASFLGMNEIPLVYGMTIGEYASMINEERWLENGDEVKLKVIPLLHYTHNSSYSLPIRPSPNLPNDTAIALYPSLGLFEGTNINAGRGTEFQFQRYGASFLDSTAYDFTYIPKPNFGSKYPKEEGKICFGQDLAEYSKMKGISLQWLLDAYVNCVDKSKFFNQEGFARHAGTSKLQEQIEAGWEEQAIKNSWEADLQRFKEIRKKYLRYP